MNMIPRYNDEVYPVMFSSDFFRSSSIVAICSTHKDARNFVSKLESELTEEEIAKGCQYGILCFDIVECKD
tara:strand:- start:117 stop:329 length:213 start_codon:yes stop_codon:yes gene_type:complete